jgi:hypothetical protein
MQSKLLWAVLRATIVLWLAFGIAGAASAQNVAVCPSPNPLCLDNNYFVTGDYVVGGVGLRGMGVNGFATGMISIPDCVQFQAMHPSAPCTAAPVPAGAEIVAAWLYWETVESTSQTPPHPGQTGFFKPLGKLPNGSAIPGNGYPIMGTILGNPNAPTSWASGGCSGSSQGAKTIVAYRADVRPYMFEDVNGNLQANGSFQVMLADSGSNGGGTPLTLGASLVIVYRVLASANPAMPLNAIVLYDGAAAPSNQGSTMTQPIQGFYEPALNPKAKLTHIVGDGQSNKYEQVSFHSQPLAFPYPAFPNTAFPGIYNGSWDNPTWDVSALVMGGTLGANGVPAGFDPSETTSVAPSGSGSGCVDWGVIIFSTTVQDSDGDGLLDVWETGQGYNDAISVQNGLPNPFVALPGANPLAKDIYAEIGYLTDLDGSVPGELPHSHLPKQQALDMVGDAFAKQGINIHFDVGSNYAGLPSTACTGVACPTDPYIIQNGTGGKPIPESATLCTDPVCEFPGTPAVGWKGGYLFVKDNPTVPGNPAVPLGNFQFGRKSSYHYVLFAHALGEPASFWTTYGSTLNDNTVAQLLSISNAGGSTFTVTIQTPLNTPQQVVYPGFCPNQNNPLCSGVPNASLSLITITGAIGQTALNGTYQISNLNNSASVIGGVNVNTTTFNITIPGVPSGPYNFYNESRLEVDYLGPSSSSGHSDFPGGADTAVTFGLWPVDDPAGCQLDPSKLKPGQTACDNEVGTIQAQAGTLLHEMGHTLTLAHGGIFYPIGNNVNGTLVPGGQQVNNSPYVSAAYGLNCNPAFVSSMNYLFQIRGFPGPLPQLTLSDGNQAHPIDYSGQTLAALSEIGLNEQAGIGNDIYTLKASPYYTRWYGPPTALQTQTGQGATFHCDGTIKGPNEPPAVRINGSTLSAPIDWDNDNDATETAVPWQDVNFNGSTSASPDPPPSTIASPVFNDMQGFNDWVNADLTQIGAREGAAGSSGGATGRSGSGGGGATGRSGSGGGGATSYALSGAGATGRSGSGGGGQTGRQSSGGGGEQNVETACSIADAPLTLTATPGNKLVVLNWQPPGGPCQVNTYTIWKSTNGGPFVPLTPLPRGNKGLAPPTTTFTDMNVKNNNTYTYFVTESNIQGSATSDASNQVTVIVK